MGDRGNIVVRQEKDTNKGDVWFYGHWAGHRLEETVREALAKRWRWNDYSYLARIIFDCFTEGDQGGETGFGISTSIGDNEHPIFVVDCPNQRVYEIGENKLVDGRLPDKPHIGSVRSFEDFIAVTVAKE